MRRISKCISVCILYLFVNILTVKAQETNQYYPLQVGNRWEYKLESVDETIPKQSEIVVEAFTHKFGIDVFEVRSKDLHKDNGSCHWYEVTNDGAVVWRALGTADKLVLVEWEPTLVILPGKPAETGKTWKHVIEQFRSDYPDSVFYAVTNFTVENVKETVTVPAGVFTDCIKIKCAEYDPGGTFIRELYHWYAPGVGNVKTIVKEPDGKSLQEELVAYEVK